MKKILSSGFTLIFLSGCLFDGGSTHLTGEYDVTWIDMECNRTIQYGPVYQMKGYVYEVHWDDNFILAKRHPGCNLDSTDYYIIDIKKNNSGCYDCLKGVFGPFNKAELAETLNRLNIPQKLKHHENFE